MIHAFSVFSTAIRDAYRKKRTAIEGNPSSSQIVPRMCGPTRGQDKRDFPQQSKSFVPVAGIPRQYKLLRQ